MAHFTMSPSPLTAPATTCGALPPKFFGVGAKIPCFLCVFRAISDAKWAQKGGFGALLKRKCGGNVEEVWTKCGVGRVGAHTG
jgi:hypothetical protein